MKCKHNWCVFYKQETPTQELQRLLDKWPERATYTDLYLFVSRPPVAYDEEGIDISGHLDLTDVSIESLQDMFDSPTKPEGCIYVTKAQAVAMHAANKLTTEE